MKKEAELGKSRFKIDDDGRECSACNSFLPWSAYGTSPKGTRGMKSSCRACLRSIKARKDLNKRNAQQDKCWVCLKYKPVKDFYRATGSFGRQFFCKDCHVTELDTVVKYFPLSTCSVCKKTKPRNDFYSSANYFDGCLVPLHRGGHNTFDNSVLCCHRCNTRKQDKSAEEFFKILKKEV